MQPITPTESVSTPAASTPVDFEHLLKPASRPSPQQHSLTNAPALNGVAGTTDRLPDIVWGPGKSADQIAAALVHLTITQRLALAVRIEPEMYAAVRKHAPGKRASRVMPEFPVHHLLRSLGNQPSSLSQPSPIQALH